MALEEMKEKCGKCEHFAIRVQVTYQNGSFASCLKCSNCGATDIMVSIYS